MPLQNRDAGFKHALQPFWALGLFRVITLQNIWEFAYCRESEHNDILGNIRHFTEGVKTVAMSLGIEIGVDEIVPQGLKGLDEPVDFLVGNALLHDKVRERLLDQYGVGAALAFDQAQAIGLMRTIGSIFKVPDPRRLGPARRTKVRAERRKAIEALTALGELLRKRGTHVANEFGSDFAQLCSRVAPKCPSGRWSNAEFEGVFDRAESPINSMVPHFPLIHERQTRAAALQADIAACTPGRDDWEKFEGACVRSLRFLFVPPFRKVTVQVRDESGHERRDAILPNNQFVGFWNLVRQEFDCKHIVCEFKNGVVSAKDDLSQLRIYLSKPTIGRFGLLFHRGTASASLLQARRNAYEQSRIMILLIDEIALSRLLAARVFLASADPVLEDMKAEFEIKY